MGSRLSLLCGQAFSSAILKPQETAKQSKDPGEKRGKTEESLPTLSWL